MPRRVDQASLLIPASPGRLWQAWVEPEELTQWLTLPGMRAQIEVMEPRPGGAFRGRIVADDPAPAPGTAAPPPFVMDARYEHLDPPHAFTLTVTFAPEDQAFADRMLLEWRYAPRAGGTLVTITASHAPGIVHVDHQSNFVTLLDNLARHVAAHPD